MKLNQLLKDYAIPSELKGIQVNGLCLDSRKVKRGCVFVALRGTATDGKKYIGAAVSGGAVAVLMEGDIFSVNRQSLVPEITIPKLAKKLSSLAGLFYGDPSKKLKLIGVTGTNGKSTCVSLLAQASQLLAKTPAWQIGTVGYGKPGSPLIDAGLTTPDAISCQQIIAEAKKEASFVAMEVSSHAVVQSRVAGLDFNAAVFTNISRDHLDYHKTFEEYCEAKLSFLRDYQLDYVVLNLDDEFAQEVVNKGLIEGVRVYTFSLRNKQADLYANDISSSLEGQYADLHGVWGEAHLRTALVGEFNLSNLLAVICVLAAEGNSLAEVAEVVMALRAVEGRLQKVELPEENQKDLPAPTVFIDYAHTPDALVKVISTLQMATGGDMWTLFGCGGDRDKGKRAQMARASEDHSQTVIVTSDNPRTEDPQLIIDDILAGLTNREKANVFIDRKHAIEFAVREAPGNACLLIAGKGHEKYQQVGQKRIPFDDYLVAQNALVERLNIEGARL